MGKKDAKVQKKAQQEQTKVDKKKQEQKKKVEEPESDSEESSEEEKPAKVVAQDSSSESDSDSDSDSEVEQKNNNGKRPLETSAQPVAKKQKTETGAADADVPEVFVGNLPQGVTEEEVSEFFGSCGEIVKVRILGAARPNAFLQFASQDGVNASLELNGNDFNGNTIGVEVARKKGGAPATGGKGVSCFIGNLSFNSTTDSIREFFTDCGNVVDVRIITDKETGRMKG